MIILDLREKNEVLVRPLMTQSVNISANSEYERVMNFIKEEKEDFLLICSSGNRAKYVYDKLSKEDKEKCEAFHGTPTQFNRFIENKNK